MLTRTPWTPPAQLAAERAIVSQALTLGPDADPAVWALAPGDLYDYRHAALWRIAVRARADGKPGHTDPAIFDAATPRYLALVATTAWPVDMDRLVERVRAAAATRRLLDACWHLCDAWADDDIARWRREVATIAEAAKGPSDRRNTNRTAAAYAARASRYEVRP